jgi:hypothetical protein
MNILTQHPDVGGIVDPDNLFGVIQNDIAGDKVHLGDITPE